MQYLRNLLSTKQPSQARLLDSALVLAVLPHLFVLKSLMLLYILIALGFIFKKETTQKDSYALLGIGLFLIILSFFNNYNFSDFSRMQFFVSLISSLLILAATLQRATKESNFYLKISPALLLLLSFFFFNSIVMLFYSLATLFLFTLLLIWSRMPSEFAQVFKLTTGLFLLSLPAVVVMFIAFPRISFEKADYGFRADTYADSGYDGKMHVSDKEFIPSNRAVMEVYFTDANLSDNLLYFRGSILYSKDGITWEREPFSRSKERLVNATQKITYDITLYPHAKHFVYALDLPIFAPSKTQLLGDYTVESERPIYEKKRFTHTSALEYRLLSNTFGGTLEIDAAKSPRTTQMLAPLKALNADDKTKADLLVKLFANQKLSYTTKPKNIDLANFLDSFLFEAKNGYCVHFAAAFAQSARLVGIPSRVITGYKGSRENRVENYLLIKSADAHSWVELYLKEEGWVRFEPTATAIRNLDMPSQSNDKPQKSVFKKVNLQFMYLKYLITKWVLDYNRLTQTQILKNLLSDTLYLLQFILGIFGVVVLSLLLFGLLKYAKKTDKTMREMEKLLRALQKRGVVKKQNEAMDIFLIRAQHELEVPLEEINRLYNTLKYAQTKEDTLLKSLKEEIAKTTREVARKNPS